MSGPQTSSPVRQISARVHPRHSWMVLPSWVGSVMFHAVLATLIIVLAQLPSCQRDIAGNDGDSFRDVGIRLVPAQPVESPRETQESSPSDATDSAVRESNAISELPPSPDSPPVPLSLPKAPEMPALLGSGAPSGLPTASLDSLIKPNNAGKPKPGGGAPISGGTSFLGVEDVGKRFVYVIDRSYSMANDRALDAAKMELLASLQRLDETQQFQIIFYNTQVLTLDPRGASFDVFWGTDAQRLKVSEQIRGITPDSGTHHLPAILEALKYNPDVIFLLTDGTADSALSMADLAQIDRRNRHGTRIHCIEFGRGATSPLGDAGNFLKELARRNDGKYVYRDVRAGFGD